MNNNIISLIRKSPKGLGSGGLAQWWKVFSKHQESNAEQQTIATTKSSKQRKCNVW